MFGEVFLTLLPFIPASMLVLFFFVAVNVLYRALTVPPGFDKHNDGHCAACGYVLGTLSDQRCPECGVDLLKAGVLSRRMFIQLRGSSFGAIAAWTVLFFSFAGTAVAVWGGVVQTNQMMSNVYTGGAVNYTQVASYGPKTNWDETTREIIGEAFTARIEIGIDSMSQQALGGVTLVLAMPDSTEYSIEINEDGAWEIINEKDKQIATGDKLSADVIDQLFALAGFDPKDPIFRSYSSQLYVLTDAAISDGVSGLQSPGTMKLGQVQSGQDDTMNLTNYGWSTDYSGTTVTTTGFSVIPKIPFSVWSPILYTFLGLCVIYLVGVVWILRRRRKLLNLGRYTPGTSVE
jgi:hypothetical protein